MKQELPKSAFIIGLIMTFGLPVIDYIDKEYITSKMQMRSYLDKSICEQTPDKCWIKTESKNGRMAIH